MRKVMAFRTFEWPEKAQNSLGWLKKYLFFGLILAQLHIYLGTYTVLRKYQITHNVHWDHSWVEVNRRLCWFTFNYQHYFPLLPITLTAAWQLLLVSCNAKAIQPQHCNAYCKSACSALHKWLYWEFGVSTIVFVLL